MTTLGHTTCLDNKVHETAEVVTHAFPWANLVGLILSAAFGLWAWVVKSFGQQHIESVKELGKELKEMRRDINSLGERIRVVEVVQKHYHSDV